MLRLASKSWFVDSVIYFRLRRYLRADSTGSTVESSLARIANRVKAKGRSSDWLFAARR